jgi:hypothetical protein
MKQSIFFRADILPAAHVRIYWQVVNIMSFIDNEIIITHAMPDMQ